MNDKMHLFDIHYRILLALEVVSTIIVLWLFARPVLLPAWYENRGRLSLTSALLSKSSEMSICDLAQAESHFRRALMYNCAMGNASLGLGIVLVQSNKPGLAVGVLEQSAHICPSPQFAYLWLGNAYEAIGDHEAAISAWRKAEAASYFYHLALLEYRPGSLDDARRHLQTVVQIDPDFGPYAYFLLGILQWGSIDGISAFQNAWRLGPESSMGYSALGWVALWQGELELARDYFIQAWQVDPGPSWSYEGLADVAVAAGADEDVEHYESFIGRPPFERVCHHLSIRWRARGNEERAAYWEKCGRDK